MKRASYWILLSFLSGTAAAATYEPSDGPNWQTICMAAVAIVAGLIAAYVRGMQGRVEKLETSLTALDRIVNRDYHTKPELERLIDRAVAPITHQMGEVKESIDTLHARMDGLRIVRTKPHGDDHD